MVSMIVVVGLLTAGVVLLGMCRIVRWRAQSRRRPAVRDRFCVQYSPRTPLDISEPHEPHRLGFGIDVVNTGDLIFSVVGAEAKVAPSEQVASLAEDPPFREARDTAYFLLPGERCCAVVDFVVDELLKAGAGAADCRHGFKCTIRARIQTLAGQRYWTPWTPPN